MIRAVPLIVFLLLVLGLAACGDDAPSASLSGDLRYVKSGGFAGDHVELFVRPSGDAKVRSRRGGEREFMLSEQELHVVASESQDLPDADALSQRPAPDAFVHSVTYDGRTVRTDDPNLSKSGMSPLIGELQKILRAHGG